LVEEKAALVDALADMISTLGISPEQYQTAAELSLLPGELCAVNPVVWI
jgi:hypothetical protein